MNDFAMIVWEIDISAGLTLEMRLYPIEFVDLFDGFDWSRMQMPKRVFRPAAAA